MRSTYKATYIALIFAVSSYLAYYTFLIPIFVIWPVAIPLEQFFSDHFAAGGYAETGTAIIITLSSAAIFLTTLFYIIFIRQLKKNKSYNIRHFIIFLCLQLFVIHPLFFYIDLSSDWSRASDGQFALSVGENFRQSSFVFLWLGVILDLIAFCIKKAHTGSN